MRRLQAEIIHLAQLDALVAQDAVGGHHMEHEVGQAELGEVGLAAHAVFFTAQDHLDLACFLAVDGVGWDAFEEMYGAAPERYLEPARYVWGDLS